MRLALPVVSMLLMNDKPYFLARHSRRDRNTQACFSSSSALYKHSEWNLMQADLPKHLMRKVQTPQRRARQVGLKVITSHHCSLAKGLSYESSTILS